MGSRDIRHREPKKPKKGAQKLPSPEAVLPAPVEVEVIKKKGRKPREEEE